MVGKFMENLYESFKFRERLSTSRQKNYIDTNVENPPHEHHVTAYDGDCIRRVLVYILDPNNLAKYKSFLQYKVICACKQYCTKELYEEFFDFYSRKLGGQKEMKSVEKRSVAIVNAFAGEMLGKIYVDKYFPQECKDDVLNSISKVLDVMRESMKTNDWLTDETKKNALKKLDKFKVKIGYPDVWKDYSKFNVTVGDSLYVISKKATQWSLQVNFYDKLNSVLDRNEWHMTPQTVNAYFMPTQNEIVFPAAILQPPFYCRSVDDIDFNFDDEKNNSPELLTKATNFGGIGAVIAHEITHGYDDQGRKFDSDGNLNDWWLSKDAELFKAKTELMATQADKYKFIDLEDSKEYGMNAQLTMGENLADLGGLSLSLKALQNHLTDNNVETNSEAYKGYLRVFFKSFANIWKQNSKKDFLINQLTTDPHAPCDFRGNIVKNINTFYDVFDVKEGDGMYISKDERITMY
jgi:putative endopeptidase